MTGPDARPVGETAELARNAEGDAECVLKGAIVGYGECESALQDASWKTVVLPRLYAYRDACKAEARAALLRDAPTVWVATNARSVNVSAIYNHDPQMRRGVATNDDEDDGLWLWGRPPLTPPGTVRRYALVPPPEGEATPT